MGIVVLNIALNPICCIVDTATYCLHFSAWNYMGRDNCGHGDAIKGCHNVALLKELLIVKLLQLCNNLESDDTLRHFGLLHIVKHRFSCFFL